MDAVGSALRREDADCLKSFTKPVPQTTLDIQEKNRSNLFAWRGQFSPQLIECLLDAYCLPDSTVLDPFAGSGTVMCEAARASLPAFGFEINPSAWSFGKVHEFVNLAPPAREAVIVELRTKIEHEFPIALRHKRVFTNRFGEAIREDILNLQRASYTDNSEIPGNVGRAVAGESLAAASPFRYMRGRRIRTRGLRSGIPLRRGSPCTVWGRAVNDKERREAALNFSGMTVFYSGREGGGHVLCVLCGFLELGRKGMDP